MTATGPTLLFPSPEERAKFEETRFGSAIKILLGQTQDRWDIKPASGPFARASGSFDFLRYLLRIKDIKPFDIVTICTGYQQFAADSRSNSELAMLELEMRLKAWTHPKTENGQPFPHPHLLAVETIDWHGIRIWLEADLEQSTITPLRKHADFRDDDV